ncbi:hypothetical protein ILUMI_26907 [Ignelater luminosus]|uniref:DDE-1 domain-containing protein n=1 Tax=Ignelater luminosus TaxID=2038154 RepID=A0A8K0C610_IGNLU|nr:hypothetical protein ILUMI_26907 [Ignelater luminosus]
MIDPFVVNDTSLSYGPSKTEIVGTKGKPSFRTTSSSGKENTTVLFAKSASVSMAPPLIVFKGKNIWHSWLAVKEHAFEGTVYVASLRAFEAAIPVLLIYDSYSIHINIKLFELTPSNDITIFKLPPYTNHIL